jgi:hypothetical protein
MFLESLEGGFSMVLELCWNFVVLCPQKFLKSILASCTHPLDYQISFPWNTICPTLEPVSQDEIGDTLLALLTIDSQRDPINNHTQRANMSQARFESRWRGYHSSSQPPQLDPIDNHWIINIYIEKIYNDYLVKILGCQWTTL